MQLWGKSNQGKKVFSLVWWPFLCSLIWICDSDAGCTAGSAVSAKKFSFVSKELAWSQIMWCPNNKGPQLPLLEFHHFILLMSSHMIKECKELASVSSALKWTCKKKVKGFPCCFFLSVFINIYFICISLNYSFVFLIKYENDYSAAMLAALWGCTSPQLC